MRQNKGILFLSILLAIFALTACTGAPPPTTPDPIPVEMLFREFYGLRGGEKVLGKAISPIFERNGMQYQILENAIMVYKPSEPPGEQFDFEPVANNFGIKDVGYAGLSISNQVNLGGLVIYDRFINVFESMGGVRFVGYPLTHVRKNDEAGRYEQFFEKMGFYILYDDPVGTVNLLPYGLIKCSQNDGLGCNQKAENAIIQDLPPEPFLPILDRLNGMAGKPLSQVSQATDGKYEQLYENAMLAFDPQNPRMIEFRPLPELIGIKPQPPVAPRDENGMAFLPVTDSLGYNVPTAFLEYIANHGSSELSGQPIGELFETNGLRQQCFTNYCLAYDPAAPESERIRPISLGYEYLKQRGYSLPDIQLKVWENIPYIEPGKPQIVGVIVYNQTPDSPIDNVQPTLTVFFGNGEQQKFTFPPTSEAGASFVEVPGIKTLGLVEYEICIAWPDSEPICAKDSWVVK